MSHRALFLTAALLVLMCGCRTDRPPEPDQDQQPVEALPPLTEADDLELAGEQEAVTEVGAVERNGERLTISLRTGEEVVLEDIQEGSYERDRLYRYRGLLDEIDYHMVEVRMYEGGGFLLIRHSDGQQIFVDAPPVISPDRSRFVTTSMDLANGYEPTAIRVYRIEPGGIENEWAYEAMEWGPSDARWVTNERIEFTRNFPDADGHIERTDTGVLRYVDNDWVLGEP